MAEQSKVLNDWLEQHLLDLHTAMFAKIVSFDYDSQTASIQPLFKTKEFGGKAMSRGVINNVPVLSHRYVVNDYKNVKLDVEKHMDDYSGAHQHEYIDQYTAQGATTIRATTPGAPSGSEAGDILKVGRHYHTKQCYPDPIMFKVMYYPGDIVFVVFAERALSGTQNGNEVLPNVNRRHDLADAVVIGGFFR